MILTAIDIHLRQKEEMRHIIIAVLLVISSCPLMFSQDNQKQKKHFERVITFPDGKQTSYGGTVGAVWTNPNMIKIEQHLFAASYDKVWSAAKRATQEFAKMGRRPIVIDEERGRISNSNVGDALNKEATLIATTWVDELKTEVTKIDKDNTKVTVTRKVYDVRTGNDGQKGGAAVLSNGKIERWLLTQIEDGINDPNLNLEIGASTTIADSEILDNQQIIDMVKARISDRLIESKIKKTTCKFDTSAKGMIRLRENGLSEGLIQFIMEHDCKERPDVTKP
ncbi:MAG: hypothetical protein M3458_00375 [Acidobacteriota bacterium]|nr:hypothetical protein [Acidobacteriota bacterium]